MGIRASRSSFPRPPMVRRVTGHPALRHADASADAGIVVGENDSVRWEGLRALVVEWRAGSRELIASALEEAGLDVTTCPGPSGPDYECLGGRGLPCPLVAEADVVVLDLRLQSDEMDAGVPGWQLAMRYREAGRPLVVLGGEGDAVTLLREPGVAVLPRRPAPSAIVDAVRLVLAESAGRRTGNGANRRP